MFALLVMMACHKPVYETQVIRVPPASPEAHSCIESCAAVRDPCVKKAKSLMHMCESQAAAMYAQCMAARGAKLPPDRLGPPINAVGCLKTPCFDSLPRCIEAYDACFTECGGSVTTDTRCVKRCPE